MNGLLDNLKCSISQEVLRVAAFVTATNQIYDLEHLEHHPTHHHKSCFLFEVY